MAEITFTLNGTERTASISEDTSLLELLRERCRVTSPKDACAPSGQCGACVVLVDGEKKTACAFPARKVEGRSVVTLEGISPREREALGTAFAESGAVQCGFCIPGMVMCGKHLLDKNPCPSRAEISRALSGHLCRCTGYVKIIDAIEQAGQALRSEPPPACDRSGQIGTALPRFRGKEMALGTFHYLDDLSVPGLLHGALVLSAHPRAQVVSIDVSAARALPGVVAVVGAAELPGLRHQGLIYRDWPIFVAQGEVTRYTGDVLCAIAAESKELAKQAAALVSVQYDVLTPLASPEASLREGAPLLHPENGHADNILSTSKVQRGDVVAAEARSAYVVEETFRTQFIEHAFMEPESCLAVPVGAIDVDGQPSRVLHVYSQGQGIYDDRRQIASALALPEAEVQVTLVSAGGAFGGKEDLSVQAQTALLAQVSGRPVKLTLDRVESIRMHVKRHPLTMRYRVGCDASGRLTFVKVNLVGDKGAYASVGSKVIERACGHATGAYDVEHVDVCGIAVYTNNPPCGAMRGFGANQANFAMESALDMLAERLGMDAWEIRYKNALSNGATFCSGQKLQAVGLRQTLEAVRPHYLAARAQGKAVGLACGIKNVGIGNGMADLGRAALTVHPDGTITIANGYTEMGQGLFTVLIQVASTVTGLPPEIFTATVDTKDEVPSGMTTASRATVCAGRAVMDAAAQLKAALATSTLAELSGQRFDGVFSFDKTSPLGAPVQDPITHLSFGYATQLVILNQAGQVERVVAAHDVGRALNPKLLTGQIEGSIHMGLGFALTEELVVEGSQIQNPTLRGIGIIRADPMPAIDVLLVEEHEPEGPFGAKGVGEIGLVPTAPAVANALYQHDKVRRYSLPMRDSAAARALHPQPKRQSKAAPATT